MIKPLIYHLPLTPVNQYHFYLYNCYMKNSNKLSNDVKDNLDNSPETNEELFLYYSDLCDSLQRTYAVISFYREHYKSLIPTPENVE